MKRRDFLKTAGVLAAGSALSSPLASASPLASPASAPVEGDLNDLKIFRSIEAQVDKPVTVIIIGAGNRGRTYSGYASLYPKTMKVVGVSDILDHRLKYLSDKHNVAPEMRFGHYREVFASGKKLADAVIICTPDDRHFEPCMKALELGYDVLLEKPMAQTEKECRAILAQSKKYNRIVGICHVLRYAPYFMALRHVLRSGAIGEIVSFQHMEPIQYAHMAHSYVRGNWRNSKETTPIILAKSCHDLDILRWLLDKPCKSIVADASLHLFKAENAPEGAPSHCTDGCPHEATCPYSAIDIYCKRKAHLGVFDLNGNRDPEVILQRLKDPAYSSYGRCVYHCDNDQPDHYVAEMVFEGNETATFSMEAFSPYGGRRTRIMGTTGYIEGDGGTFTVYDFRSGRKNVWNKKVSDIPEYKGSGHGGGDLGLVRDFLEAVGHQDPTRLTSTIEASIESHVMGFAAERSRKSGKKEKVKV